MIKHKTLQEAGDFAVKKIVAQGKQCGIPHPYKYDEIECLYADGEGNHCALGWLFDPKDQELMASKQSIESLIFETEHDLPALIVENHPFFTRLQQFHDHVLWTGRKTVFNNLVEDYGDVVDFSGEHWQKWIDMGELYQK